MGQIRRRFSVEFKTGQSCRSKAENCGWVNVRQYQIDGN